MHRDGAPADEGSRSIFSLASAALPTLRNRTAAGAAAAFPGVGLKPRVDDVSPVRRRPWNPLTLAFIGALWLASLCNWPLWRAFFALPDLHGAPGVLFMLAFFVIVTALLMAMLALFAWRWSIQAVLSLFLLSAAVGAHFMGVYNVYLDPKTIGNTLQTNFTEARDLMGLPFALSVLLLAVLPMAWLWRRRVVQARPWRQGLANLGSMLLALAVVLAMILASFQFMASTMRNHKSLRYLVNPINSYWSLGVVMRGDRHKAKGPLLAIGTDAHPRPLAAGAKPPLLMLQVGETGRAGNWQLNGYPRPTNPELSREGVTSFTAVTSCDTDTAGSVPCMFSPLGRVGYNARKQDTENLLDVLQRAGYAVLWIDNQSGCKNVCDRVPHVATTDPVPGGAPLPAGLCGEGDCLDMALLHGLDQRLAALPAERRAVGVVLVLHQMGGHGPAYSRRSPPDRKPFQPECTTSALQQCEHQALVNAYDNSIAYTDHVLAQSIEWLKGQSARYEPSLIYVADHGESLGEHNIYLHGLPYAMAPSEQTHVAMIAWGMKSPGSRVNVACLDKRRDVPLSHDNLFHTVLGVLDVSTSLYDEKLDAFAGCQRLAGG